MQNMPVALWDIWEAGDFTGPNRPYARITIQKAVLKTEVDGFPIGMKTMFNQDEPQIEFPQAVLKSLNIDRRLGTDAAQMTLVIKNALPIDPTQDLNLSDGGLTLFPGDYRSALQLRDLGHPGYFTFRRGVNATNQIGWAYASDPIWVDMLIPNRVIRTWQGYGTDGAANPWDDTRQVQTGTWLIDKVELSSSGDITITCRDYLKLAIEQRLYPDVIPLLNYPLEFCADHFETHITDPPDPASVNVAQHNFEDYDSSVGYQTNVWNQSVFGHTAGHAFDGDESTYWLSLGHSTPGGFGSFEWISADTNGNPINFVQFRPWKGGYQVYVCVKVGGIWQGSATVPYNQSVGETNTGAQMAYVAGPINVPASETWFGITLPERYNADQVRVVFTNLRPWTDGSYRAGVYGLGVYDHPFVVGEGTPFPVEEFVEGNIKDYVDIIKVFAGWAGFFWPGITPWDPALTFFGENGVVPDGRIWGDFFNSGAYPVDPPCIPPSFWDNKSIMDGINQIKEILGYIVYCDPTGGLVVRMPNIWRTGNYVLGEGFVGGESVRVIDEKHTLLDLGVSLDDQALRSEIIVVSSEDSTLHRTLNPTWAQDLDIPGTVLEGDFGLLAGQERTMLVPNFPFGTQDEVDKFAYLVSLWLHWTFRKDRVRIPGCPAFFPDDQVTIYERVTHEQFVHYIEGVTSSMDFQSGTWYMDIDTHWLGEGPDRVWLVNSYEDMPGALYAYLLAIGEIEEGVGTPPPVFALPEFATTDVWDRVNADFANLFPGLPDINLSDWTLSDEELAELYANSYLVPPAGGSSGTVVSRSEQFYRSTWGAPGSNQTQMTFMTSWQSIYDNPPIGYPVPLNTSINQASTVRITCNALAVPAFGLLGELMGEEFYQVWEYQTGCYNYRFIAGTNVLSVHSWGLAIDINWTANAVNKPSSSISTAFKVAAQRARDEIRTNNGKQVFGWGGDWSSKKDWMHLEIVCTAADIKTGVHR